MDIKYGKRERKWKEIERRITLELKDIKSILDDELNIKKDFMQLLKNSHVEDLMELREIISEVIRQQFVELTNE